MSDFFQLRSLEVWQQRERHMHHLKFRLLALASLFWFWAPVSPVIERV